MPGWQFWLTLTLLGPAPVFALAVPSISALGVVLFGFVHSTQTLHNIKASGLMKPESLES